jgi:MFS family permease
MGLLAHGRGGFFPGGVGEEVIDHPVQQRGELVHFLRGPRRESGLHGAAARLADAVGCGPACWGDLDELALAVSLIAIGKAGDRFGRKKVFLARVAGFAASSAAIGLSGSIAGSITLVIAFRALQGVFGAMLQPTALALLRNTFPREKLNGAIGAWGAVIGASTAAGPIVGGLLVQHIGWEACFYVNVPVGAAAVIMSLLVLKETPSSTAAASFDVPGIAALSGALFALIFGLIKGRTTAGLPPARWPASAPPPCSGCCSSSASPGPASRCCR